MRNPKTFTKCYLNAGLEKPGCSTSFYVAFSDAFPRTFTPCCNQNMSAKPLQHKNLPALSKNYPTKTNVMRNKHKPKVWQAPPEELNEISLLARFRRTGSPQHYKSKWHVSGRLSVRLSSAYRQQQPQPLPTFGYLPPENYLCFDRCSHTVLQINLFHCGQCFYCGLCVFAYFKVLT